MATQLSWGIIGTGNIAHRFAQQIPDSQTGKLVAVASRSAEKAKKFASEFNIPVSYGSYDELLADKGVQAVYISTPHPQHSEWTIKAARAGKHILCEKPIALNHPAAMAMVQAARENDVFLMEAFMYRCHPQTAKLVELLRQKVVGEVRVIKAAFSFRTGFNAQGRLFNNALGGGGIMDVGCYPVSFVRMVAGVAMGGDFAEPIDVKACGHIGTTGVDEYAVATMKFPGEILASIGAGVTVWQDPSAQIFCTDGVITMKDPWIPAREGGSVKIIVHKSGQEPQEIVIETPRQLYAFEIDTVANCLDKRQACFPAMNWDDTLGNMKALDMWRQSMGQVFDSEKPGNVPTASGQKLAVRQPARMTYAPIPGVGRPVSRLVMGADYQRNIVHASAMMDDFFERGGNCIDTAHIYGGGASEKVVGQWVASRGIRKDVVILDKGAHTPDCNPAGLVAQHKESLCRLGMDCVDIYMMHRDNPQVPVGEFIDAMNQMIRAGSMRALGASNWTLERIIEANRYAQDKGLTGFVAVSNNFSLAQMVQPPWSGCLANSDAASRAWFTKTQMVMMPWSSQARGFFSRGNGADTSDAELVRCWYSPDNFQRLQRAGELAKKYKVDTTAIALAYVLRQPFPTFPLIGPRLISETASSMAGLDVELTDDEVKWLNLEQQ